MSAVTVEDEKQDGAGQARAASPTLRSPDAVIVVEAHAPPELVVPSPSPSAADALSASPAASPSAASLSSSSAAASTLTFPLRILSIHSSYTGKSNHYSSSDPLVVVAVDNRPLFRTSIKHDCTHATWDCSRKEDIQKVAGGIHLSASDPTPTFPVAVSTLASSQLQVRQEDFSRSKEEDDLGGFSMALEEIVARAWKKDYKPKSAPVAAATAASGADAASSPASPASPASAVSSPVVDGWYPVSIDNAPLLDRVSGRHLGEVSLKLSVQLEPYLRFLAASQTNLHLLSQLVAHWLDNPSPDTPLRHLLLNQESLASLVAFVVRAASDKGSMDGQRMRERIYPMLHKALDVFGAPTILPLLFANNSAIWASLFELRCCVPVSQLTSPTAWALYTSLLESYMSLAERAASILEPVPPPPVKSAEELEAERVAAELAEKRRKKKEKAAAAAAAAAGDDEPVSARGASSKKKKKSLLGLAALAEPPVLPPSNLCFALSGAALLRELFEAIHVRLGGFKRAGAVEIDWTAASEAKLADLVACLELLWRVQHFVCRYGGESAAARQSAADHFRPLFFARETGDAHALWLQKTMVSIVKKSKDTLAAADNRDLAGKMQQHADYFAKTYPTEAKPKKSAK